MASRVLVIMILILFYTTLAKQRTAHISLASLLSPSGPFLCVCVCLCGETPAERMGERLRGQSSSTSSLWSRLPPKDGDLIRAV